MLYGEHLCHCFPQQGAVQVWTAAQGCRGPQFSSPMAWRSLPGRGWLTVGVGSSLHSVAISHHCLLRGLGFFFVTFTHSKNNKTKSNHVKNHLRRDLLPWHCQHRSQLEPHPWLGMLREQVKREKGLTKGCQP